MITQDIGITGLIIGYLLLLIPIAIAWWLKIKIIRSTIVAAIRMGVQLLLIGIFLEYLFELNHALINLTWLIIMIIVASFAIIRSSELQIRHFIFPAFASLAFSTLLLVFIINTIILDLDNIYDAPYLIAIGGMLLGNSLKGNIIGITTFYKSIKRNEARYFYILGNGGSRYEALMPHLQASFKNAMDPFIATMATFGIVSLPGMMTGQILGGVSPMIAIKYQISIAIAIFVVTALSILLTILLSFKNSFDEYAVLNKKIFRDNKQRQHL